MAIPTLLHAAPATPGGDEVSFSVLDQLGDTEVEEATTLYVDNRLIGTFRLDAGTASQSFTVHLPRAESYEFALCGRVTTRAPDGTTEAHDVNTSGRIYDPDGRQYEAMTDGFSRFYLRDRTEDMLPGRIDNDAARRCTPAISMR